jgi:uncharacterized protein YacL
MNTTVKIIRFIFVLACIIMGTIWAKYVMEEMLERSVESSGLTIWMAIGGFVGCVVALLVLFLLRFVTQELYERIAPALVAIVMAMVMGYFVGQYILFLWAETGGADDVTLRIFVVVTLVLLFGFAGISLGLTRASNWESLISAVQWRHNNNVGLKLVDTSVIIDGRIKDVCESGFIEGTLLVPRFVLRELQNIADSSDVLRRAKGRRGLDILKILQEHGSRVKIEIIEDNPSDVREVDGKLVRLARQYNAKIFTNDFNLNKVAQIEGVEVLNINDLANALKPVVLPDEQMEVKVIKEGKEPNQGVGYLDDGTMIVVDGGRAYMGKVVEVVVTSVLQTAAGRMIFTRFNNLVT